MGHEDNATYECRRAGEDKTRQEEKRATAKRKRKKKRREEDKLTGGRDGEGRDGERRRNKCSGVWRSIDCASSSCFTFP